MTTATGKPPTHRTPADHARVLLTSAVVGAALTAFISGCATSTGSLVIAGLVLLPGYGLLFFLLTIPSRVREASVAPHTALAKIEDLEAIGGEGSDVPVRFELTVAPDDARAFRVEIRDGINLVDLPGYRPRGIVVVQYPPDRPWKGRIVKRPTPAWQERARSASLDSVPGPALKEASSESGAGCLFSLLGLAIGVGAVLGLFRHDVFDSGKTAADPPTVSASESSSASTTTTTTTIKTTVTITSDVGTVTLDPSQSMLDPGVLRTSVESLTRGAAPRKALTVVMQGNWLRVVFVPGDGKNTGFDPGSVPYDRIPALVRQAEKSPDVGSVKTWQVTAAGAGGSLTLSVVVTGDKGTATLIADGEGRVL